MTPQPVKALAVIDEAIIQAVNLGALVRTDPRLKGTPMALEVKLRELRDLLAGADPAALLSPRVDVERRCDFDCDACREPDEGWQQP